LPFKVGVRGGFESRRDPTSLSFLELDIESFQHAFATRTS